MSKLTLEMLEQASALIRGSVFETTGAEGESFYCFIRRVNRFGEHNFSSKGVLRDNSNYEI